MRIAIIDNVQIAVVDHERLTREFIVNVMMYSVNRDILVFESASAMDAYLKSGHRVHLIFVQLHLPGKSGFELLRHRSPQLCHEQQLHQPVPGTNRTGHGTPR